MLFECATITSVSDGQLALRSIRGSACARCARGEGCGGGVIGKLVYRRQPTLNVSVSNTQAYAVGQSVELSVDAGRVMSIAACLYLLPLVALLAGALAGQALFGTNAGALVAALTGLLVAFVVLRSSRAGLSGWLQPTVRHRTNVSSGEVT